MRHSPWISLALALLCSTTAFGDMLMPGTKRITNEIVIEFPEKFAEAHPGVRIYLYEDDTAGVIYPRYPDISYNVRRIEPGQPIRLINPGPSRGPRLFAVIGELPADRIDLFRLFHETPSVPRSIILPGTFWRTLPDSNAASNVRFAYRIVAIEGRSIRIESLETTRFDRDGHEIDSRSSFLPGPGRPMSMALCGIAFLGLIGLSATRSRRSRSMVDENARA